MVSVSWAYSKICNTFGQIFSNQEPLTREDVQKVIRSWDRWREYTIHPDGHPEAIAMAERAVQHTEVGLREDGLKLFYTLVTDFQNNLSVAYEPAMKAAFAAVSDTHSDIRKRGLEILKALIFTKDYYAPALVPAMKAAQAVVGDPNIDVRAEGLRLYHALLLQGESAYEPAIKAVLASIDGQANCELTQTWFALFDIFFHIKYEPAYPAAITLSRIARAHECADVQGAGCFLLSRLVQHNYEPVYSEALEAAQMAVVSTNSKLRQSGLSLFTALLKVNYDPAYPAAAIVSRMATTHACADVQRAGCFLLGYLVHHNYEPAYSEALEAAQLAVVSTNDEVWSSGLMLFETLLKVNYGYKSAKAALQKMEVPYVAGPRRYAFEEFRSAIQKYEKLFLTTKRQSSCCCFLKKINLFAMGLLCR